MCFGICECIFPPSVTRSLKSVSCKIMCSWSLNHHYRMPNKTMWIMLIVRSKATGNYICSRYVSRIEIFNTLDTGNWCDNLYLAIYARFTIYYNYKLCFLQDFKELFLGVYSILLNFSKKYFCVLHAYWWTL